MAPDPGTAATPIPASGPPTEPVPDKVRIRFRKDGPLRFLSHHDLLRTFERMLRRADLPFRRTKGFHPHPRLVFALSLPLGVVGREEVAELELERPYTPEEVHERLTRQAPPGLTLLSVARIGLKTGAQVRGLSYGLPVPADRSAELGQRRTDLLAATECWAERSRPSPRRVNLRPFLRDLRLTPGPADGRAFLEIDLWLTPEGTARPEEVLALLGLRDLLDAGAVLERTRLELHDEVIPSPVEEAGEESRRRELSGNKFPV